MATSIYQIISRKEAKEKGLKQYFTGKPCPKGHIANRTTASGSCMECMRERKKTPESKRQYKLYRENNRDKVNERQLNWYHEIRSDQLKELRKTNPDKAYKYARKWEKTHPGRKRAQDAKRRASLLQATPYWFEHDEVKSIYEESARLTKISGVDHHVDHIIPLNNSKVCGLHCKDNLRIITAKENMSKGNELNEDLLQLIL